MNYKKAVIINLLVLLIAAALVAGISFYFSRKNAAGTGSAARTPAAAAAENPEAAVKTPDAPAAKTSDPFAAAGAWFKAHPRGFGLFVLLVGVLLLAAAIFNWDWIFRGPSFNLQKIEGIANFFGRGFARIWLGFSALGCIIAGLLVIILHWAGAGGSPPIP